MYEVTSIPLVNLTPCYFSQCGVRFFRCRGINPDTHSSLLRSALQGTRIDFLFWFEATFPDKLVNSRHRISLVLTKSAIHKLYQFLKLQNSFLYSSISILSRQFMTNTRIYFKGSQVPRLTGSSKGFKVAFW